MDGQPLPDDGAPTEETDQLDPSQQYWATYTGKDLSDALKEREEAFFSSARRRGLLTQWIAAYAAFHGLDPESLSYGEAYSIGFSGDEAEFLRFFINKIYSFVSQKVTMALGELPAFQAMAVNSDHKSQVSAEIADTIVQSMYRRWAGEGLEREVTISNMVCAEGYAHLQWDAYMGDKVTIDQPQVGPDGQPMIDQQTGQPLTHPVEKKSGAPYVTTAYPWSVVRPVRRSDMSSKWRIVREVDSVWNLCAKWPEQRELILQQGRTDQYDFSQLFGTPDLFDDDRDNDRCVVKHFYHPDCAAIEGGRYVIQYGDLTLRNAKCPLSDGVPVAEMITQKYFETNFGMASSWFILPIQEALNQLNSDRLSNIALFGRGNVAMEEGTKISAQSLVDGGKVFEYPHGASLPRGVEFTAIPPESGAYAQELNAEIRDITQQNDVSRGEPGANIRSGEMAALFDSIAIRAQSPDQAAVRAFRSQLATMIVKMTRSFGESKFLVELIGTANRPYMREFLRDDLSGIERAWLEPVSPIMQSLPGRLQVFMQLKDLPPEQRPAAYDIITTGSSARFVQDDRAAELLIQAENEYLMTGQGSPAVAASFDNPFTHCTSHWHSCERIRASADQDPQAIDRHMKHIQEHLPAYLQLDPLFAGFLNIPAPPPIPPPPGAPMEFGNPAFRMQMLTGGMGAPPPSGPGPQAPGGPPPTSGPPNQTGGGAPGAPPTPSADDQSRSSMGNRLPQPSQPAQPPMS
jgi:hypothetical protein